MTDVTRRELERAAELLRRVLAGTDDAGYCLTWAGHHIAIAKAAVSN